MFTGFLGFRVQSLRMPLLKPKPWIILAAYEDTTQEGRVKGLTFKLVGLQGFPLRRENGNMGHSRLGVQGLGMPYSCGES